VAVQLRNHRIAARAYLAILHPGRVSRLGATGEFMIARSGYRLCVVVAFAFLATQSFAQTLRSADNWQFPDSDIPEDFKPV
jgi:hypothetical protein